MKLDKFKQLLSEIVRNEVRSELKEFKKSLLNNGKINENFNFTSDKINDFGLNKLKHKNESPIISKNDSKQDILASVMAETIANMNPNELKNFGTGNLNGNT